MKKHIVRKNDTYKGTATKEEQEFLKESVSFHHSERKPDPMNPGKYKAPSQAGIPVEFSYYDPVKKTTFISKYVDPNKVGYAQDLQGNMTVSDASEIVMTRGELVVPHTNPTLYHHLMKWPRNESSPFFDKSQKPVIKCINPIQARVDESQKEIAIASAIMAISGMNSSQTMTYAEVYGVNTTKLQYKGRDQVTVARDIEDIKADLIAIAKRNPGKFSGELAITYPVALALVNEAYRYKNQKKGNEIYYYGKGRKWKWVNVVVGDPILTGDKDAFYEVPAFDEKDYIESLAHHLVKPDAEDLYHRLKQKVDARKSRETLVLSTVVEE